MTWLLFLETALASSLSFSIGAKLFKIKFYDKFYNAHMTWAVHVIKEECARQPINNCFGHVDDGLKGGCVLDSSD